jgi:hypothetical protein
MSPVRASALALLVGAVAVTAWADWRVSVRRDRVREHLRGLAQVEYGRISPPAFARGGVPPDWLHWLSSPEQRTAPLAVMVVREPCDSCRRVFEKWERALTGLGPDTLPVIIVAVGGGAPPLELVRRLGDSGRNVSTAVVHEPEMFALNTGIEFAPGLALYTSDGRAALLFGEPSEAGLQALRGLASGSTTRQGSPVFEELSKGAVSLRPLPYVRTNDPSHEPR